MPEFTIVTASHDDAVLNEHLLSSPCIAGGHIPVIVKRGYRNVARAYNEGAAEAETGLVAFIHHDVFLPEGWAAKLVAEIAKVEAYDPDWGVIGCAGVRMIKDKKYEFGHILDRDVVFGGPTPPVEVDTLDEVVLVVWKKNVYFDEDSPTRHMIGVEFCLRCRSTKYISSGRCYAIDAYCEHRTTNPVDPLPPEFPIAIGYLWAAHRDMLPIATTCCTIREVDGTCEVGP